MVVQGQLNNDGKKENKIGSENQNQPGTNSKTTRLNDFNMKDDAIVKREILEKCFDDVFAEAKKLPDKGCNREEVVTALKRISEAAAKLCASEKFSDPQSQEFLRDAIRKADIVADHVLEGSEGYEEFIQARRTKEMEIAQNFADVCTKTVDILKNEQKPLAGITKDLTRLIRIGETILNRVQDREAREKLMLFNEKIGSVIENIRAHEEKKQERAEDAAFRMLKETHLAIDDLINAKKEGIRVSTDEWLMALDYLGEKTQATLAVNTDPERVKTIREDLESTCKKIRKAAFD
ncbi:MAG: hypothetical protein NTV88_01190 [Candidatus Micrarchaeota archaeon]|nr:hypothetical protein [Candidatus Micrarchaeota archaeon]